MKSLDAFQEFALPRKAMLSVTGGGTCGAYLPSGSSPGNHDFQSQNASLESSDSGMVFRNLSYSDAQAMIAGIAGARWCCDSCGSASWY
jgi:hypothetical protein